MLLHLLRQPWAKFEADDPIFVDRPVSSKVQKVTSSAAASSAISLREAVTAFLNRKRLTGIGSSQLDEIERALNWLREDLGDTAVIGEVTKESLRNFRAGVERLDGSFRGRGGIAFRDRQTGDATRWISSITARRYWQSVTAFFQWCEAEGLAEHDPSHGLKIAARKGDVRRTPEAFSQAEVRQLFASPLYAGHRSPKQVLVPGSCRERGSYWWSGLLGLYTGMRAGEIAQLLFEDFNFESEVPVVRVRNEDEAGKKVKRTKTVTARAER
jgi:integrase